MLLIFKAAWVYWLGLAVTFATYALIFMGIIPSISEMFIYLETVVEVIGLWALFPLAILENIYGFTVFFPGGIVILSGMATTSGNPGQALEALVYIHFGTQLGYLITFSLVSFLGARAFKLKTKQTEVSNVELIRRGVLMLWHPLLGSMYVAELAAVRARYLRVFPFLFVINGLYNLVWAFVIYHFGNILREEGNILLLVFCAYLLTMIGLRSFRAVRATKLEK